MNNLMSDQIEPKSYEEKFIALHNALYQEIDKITLDYEKKYLIRKKAIFDLIKILKKRNIRKFNNIELESTTFIDKENNKISSHIDTHLVFCSYKWIRKHCNNQNMWTNNQDEEWEMFLTCRSYDRHWAIPALKKNKKNNKLISLKQKPTTADRVTDLNDREFANVSIHLLKIYNEFYHSIRYSLNDYPIEDRDFQTVKEAKKYHKNDDAFSIKEHLHSTIVEFINHEFKESDSNE